MNLCMLRRALPKWGGLAVVALLLGGAPAWAKKRSFEEVQKEYEAYLARPSFWKRTLGRIRLAATRDGRALPLLQRDYEKPEDPKEEVRQTIVGSLARTPWMAEARATFPAWRKANDKAADAWLWYHTLRLAVAAGQPQPALQALVSKAPPALRCAALLALSGAKRSTIADAVTEVVSAMEDRTSAWRKGQDILAASAAEVLRRNATRRGTASWKAAATALVEKMAWKSMPPFTKRYIARCFASIYGGDEDLVSADLWLAEIRAGKRTSPKTDHRYAGPRFAGLRSSGNRLVYAIDASDSMMAPIDPAVVKRMGAVVTGTPADKPKKALSKLEQQLGAPVWTSVKTRFDLARALLRSSLVSLDEDKQFAVIVFGDDADLLETTPHLVRAKRKTIAQALAEVDRIPTGKPTRIKPHGTIRGDTNLHGALRLALKIANRKKRLPHNAYVHPDARALGAETIFLLSDGLPSTDDFRCVDLSDTYDTAVEDRESMKKTKVPEKLDFPGPYARYYEAGYEYFLLDDIARRNMLRHTKIQCVGIGEASEDFLKKLAAIGVGETVFLGKAK